MSHAMSPGPRYAFALVVIVALFIVALALLDHVAP